MRSRQRLVALLCQVAVSLLVPCVLSEPAVQLQPTYEVCDRTKGQQQWHIGTAAARSSLQQPAPPYAKLTAPMWVSSQWEPMPPLGMFGPSDSSAIHGARGSTSCHHRNRQQEHLQARLLCLCLLQNLDGQLGKIEVVWQKPEQPKGVLLLFHGCGGNATSFFPRTDACPKCTGRCL